MAVNGVGLNTAYMDRVGVDRNGNPVYFDPEKARQKKIENAKKEAQRRIQEIIDSGRSVNPTKDKVFVDPRTGELTTIKPGIYGPEPIKNAERRLNVAKLLLTGSAIAAAIVFRKPLLNVAKKGAELAGKAIETAKPYVTKAVNFVKDSAQGLATKVAKLFEKKVV